MTTQPHPMDANILPVGYRTLTYEQGKILPVEVVEATPASDPMNIYGPQYKVKYIGLDICLDITVNQYCKPGDVFTVHHNNIVAALNDVACFGLSA